MKNLISLFLCVLTAAGLCRAQSILTLVDSAQLPQATIWGVVSFNRSSLSVTTTTAVSGHAHIFLRKLDTDLDQVGSIVQITSDADPQTVKGITDHKHVFLNGNHFLTFSVRGDSDLYIFKVDSGGTRVGAITTVIQGTSDRTNDMVLTTDGTFLWVGYFHPPTQHTFHKFDQNLNAVGSPVITSTTLPHNNIGNAIFHNEKFYLFTGSTFGYNSNLILTKWNSDWTPVAGSTQTLIPSANGDGNWFSTGVAYDSDNRRWYLGFAHIYSTEPIETEHIDIVAFDENFALLERQHVTPSRYYRPHFVLQEVYLYVTYDAGGSGVFVHKYHVSQAQSTSQFTVSSRWNIVSVPLTVDDYTQTTLFPTAVSNAFAYQGGYVQKDTLSNGVGYWLKFDSAQQVSMTGLLRNQDTINVAEGWNLIGSISYPVTTSDITSIPGGMIASNFFDYASGYTIADTVKPARGYWVKVNQDGTLILSSSGRISPSQRIKIVPDAELPPSSPEVMQASLTREMPKHFSVFQNYPNPFNPITTIRFSLPQREHVTLKIFDALGREVATLINGELNPGEHSVVYNANNLHRQIPTFRDGLASGVYVYRLQAGKYVQQRTMQLIK